MTFLDACIHVSSTLMAAALVLAAYRVVRGPSLPDRVIGLDLIGVLTLGLLLITVVRTRQTVLLDVAIVLALVGFMGTVAFSRYLERNSLQETAREENGR